MLGFSWIDAGVDARRGHPDEVLEAVHGSRADWLAFACHRSI
jgi:hypothetical protein